MRSAALHAACWSGAMVLYVPKGVVIERPLHMFSVLSPGGVDLIMGTFSKAFGGFGAYVAGSRAMIDWLKRRFPK